MTFREGRKQTVIEGLHVTVPGAEVQRLLQERSAYHEQRSADYRRTHETLSAAMEAVEQEDMPKLSSLNSDPVSQAQSGMKRHAAKAKQHAFMARFVDTSERFLLDVNDLEFLGVIESRY
jgi:hypothetical protein